MFHTQVGCPYCLKALDSKDKNERLQTFVQCNGCGVKYHTACWQVNDVCLRCQSDQARPSQAPPHPRRKVVNKMHAVPIKPATIVYLEDTRNYGRLLKVAGQTVSYFTQMIRSVVLSLLLLTIATAVSIFTYRVTQLDYITPETVMDVVFRQPLPSVYVFIGAIISGLVFVPVFYSYHPLNNANNEARPGRFINFVAGVLVVAIIDLFLFNLTLQDFINLNFNLQPYLEILYAQATAALIIIFLTPLHRKLAPITTSPKVPTTPFITSLYGWGRLLISSLLLILFVTYLSIYLLPAHLNQPKFIVIPLEFSGIMLTLPMAGAFVTGLAIAAIAYWPPKFRRVKGHFGILRLLIMVVCLVSMGFMYRITDNPEGYLNAISTAAVAMLIATPVQRSLS